MKIAIASGKGGTGKTTVAINLALIGEKIMPGKVNLLDCDVEAPNAGIFLKPDIKNSQEVGIMIPIVDQEKCSACGKCAEVCAFNAISVVQKKVMVFPEVCHGCGNCLLNCPDDAISEELYPTGLIEMGKAGEINFFQGKLEIGQMMATPIIRQLKNMEMERDNIIIYDAPPGASCPFIETVKGSDFVLLVTEPTAFGLHDLKKAAEIVRDHLHIPLGVIINRDGIGDAQVEIYCRENGLEVLLKIPFEKKVAEYYSNGIPLVEADSRFEELFAGLFEDIRKRVQI